MEIEFTCDCGQVVRATFTAHGQTVQCPFCGRVLVMTAPGAEQADRLGTSWVPPAEYRPSRKAVAALVFGLCSFIPGLGVFCAPVAIGLGIAVLVKKLSGKGYGIAGLATGVGGLVLVQAIVALYAIITYVVWRNVTASMRAMAVPPVAATAPAPMVDPGQALTDDEIAAALTGPMLPTAGAKAERERDNAVALYGKRHARAGDLYRCVKHFRLYLACKEGGGFDTPAHERMFNTAREELVGEVQRKYGLAGGHEQARDWRRAERAYAEVMELVPDPENPVYQSAARHREACRALRQLPRPEEMPETAPAETPPDRPVDPGGAEADERNTSQPPRP